MTLAHLREEHKKLFEEQKKLYEQEKQLYEQEKQKLKEDKLQEKKQKLQEKKKKLLEKKQYEEQKLQEKNQQHACMNNMFSSWIQQRLIATKNSKDYIRSSHLLQEYINDPTTTIIIDQKKFNELMIVNNITKSMLNGHTVFRGIQLKIPKF